MSPMKAVRPRVSYADLERAPEDGRRYELYDGEVFVVPAPLLKHQLVQHRVARDAARRRRRTRWLAGDAPLTSPFRSSTSCSRMSSISRPRALTGGREPRDPACAGPVRGVLSPSTEATDRGKKMQMFARYGVPEYRIVDPASETVEVYELRSGAYELAFTGRGDTTVTPASLPGHSFPAGSLFPQR